MSPVQGKMKRWSWCALGRGDPGDPRIRGARSARASRSGTWSLEANRQIALRGRGRGGHRLQLRAAPCGSRFPGVQFNAGHRPIDAERFTNAKAKRTGVSASGWSRVQVCRLERSRNRGAAFRDPLPANAIGTNRNREQGRGEEARAVVAGSRRSAGHGVLKIVSREQTIVFNERVMISQF